MTFQKLNDTTLAIRSEASTLTVTPGGAIKVGDHLIEGPGEYDIGGMSLHVFDSHAFVSAESIQTCLVWASNGQLGDADDSSVDILVCLLDSVEAITALVKANDPCVVVFQNSNVAEIVANQDGMPISQAPNYKVTQSTLPVESRVGVCLT